jgi:hypothetical protein
MMTTNKLTKTFASGSLAIGVLAGSVLAATSASAMVMTSWGVFKNGDTIPKGRQTSHIPVRRRGDK